jgi:uncharacterized protein YjeT (DUF2065 family)
MSVDIQQRLWVTVAILSGVLVVFAAAISAVRQRRAIGDQQAMAELARRRKIALLTVLTVMVLAGPSIALSAISAFVTVPDVVLRMSGLSLMCLGCHPVLVVTAAIIYRAAWSTGTPTQQTQQERLAE